MSWFMRGGSSKNRSKTKSKGTKVFGRGSSGDEETPDVVLHPPFVIEPASAQSSLWEANRPYWLADQSRSLFARFHVLLALSPALMDLSDLFWLPQAQGLSGCNGSRVGGSIPLEHSNGFGGRVLKR